MLGARNRLRRSSAIAEVLKKGRRAIAPGVKVVALVQGRGEPEGRPTPAANPTRCPAESFAHEISCSVGDTTEGQPDRDPAHVHGGGRHDAGGSKRSLGNDGRQAAVVATKGFRTAVSRHRALRRVREVVRKELAALPPGRYVIVVDPRVDDLPAEDLRKHVSLCLRRAAGVRIEQWT